VIGALHFVAGGESRFKEEGAMQNTNAILHRSTTAAGKPQKHIVMIGLVAAIHVAAIYALVAGLVPSTIVTIFTPSKFIPIPPPDEKLRKDDPIPNVEKTFIDPKVPVAHEPDVNVQHDAEQTIIVARGDDHPVQIVPPTAASSLGGTHTIPPYLEMSIRMQEHGTVTLRLAIGADGGVSDAAIVTSSGSDRLDQAAVAWVKSHWRYKPATRDGAAVASTTLAAVRFDLKNAR
jgi:protein TonB